MECGEEWESHRDAIQQILKPLSPNQSTVGGFQENIFKKGDFT